MSGEILWVWRVGAAIPVSFRQYGDTLDNMATLRRQQRELQTRLSDLQDHRDKIEAELTALVTEYNKVAYALEILSQIDDQPSASRSARLTPGAEGRKRRGPTMDYALRALAPIADDASVDEVLSGMRALGWDATPKDPVETVRTTFLRAINDGYVERRAYGRYALTSKARTELELPESTDAPDRANDDDASDAQVAYTASTVGQS